MSHPKKHALKHWKAFEEQLGEQELVFLTDFDGTLVPIKPKPELAILTESTRKLLAQLHKLPTVRVGVVTGRALSNIKRQVSLRGLWYLGNHGAEIFGPQIDYVHPDIKKCIPRLKEIHKALKNSLKDVQGCQIESKQLSLSIHWRRIHKEELSRFKKILTQILKPWLEKNMIHVTQGKCVTEVRAPVNWDKGKGIDWLLKHSTKKRNISVIYMGDDKTDEDGFRVLNQLTGGISIFVGKAQQRTHARWYVKDPQEVRQLLRRIIRWGSQWK